MKNFFGFRRTCVVVVCEPEVYRIRTELAENTGKIIPFQAIAAMKGSKHIFRSFKSLHWRTISHLENFTLPDENDTSFDEIIYAEVGSIP
jgi:hypothetical protein